jgi:hypothetical protein
VREQPTHAPQERTTPRARTRAQRRRARVRVRLLLASALVAIGIALALTDLHGRSQVAENLKGLAAARHRLADAHLALVAKGIETQDSYSEVESIESSTADNQVSLTATNASISADDTGIFFDGISLPTLNTCLTGVVQVLDQIDVGQVAGALAELTNLSAVCSAVSP